MRSFHRLFIGISAAAAFALPILGSANYAVAQDDKTLRAVLYSEMRVIDPLFLSYMSRYHGYMVYDTLFSPNRAGEIKPQMVDTFEISPDRLTYTFKLRTGLAFHDGAPVRPADVIASLQRWGKVDSVGRVMLQAVKAFEPVDDLSFRIVLNKPFELLIEALGKPGTFAPFILPERLARQEPTEQITDPTGSGPFKFSQAEWVPGQRVVYVKNENYVPRAEPSDGLAGGKVVNVDRVEWLYMPDQNSAVAALQNGEIDFLELPPLDSLPQIEANPELKLASTPGLADWQGQFRINHLHPPFNSEKGRQALMRLIDQKQFMTAIGAAGKFSEEYCSSYFLCGSPYQTSVGDAVVKNPSVEAAKALFAESGYNGELVVVIQPVDLAVSSTASQLIYERLKAAGINVELFPADFGTMQARRVKKEAPSEGGWSIFPNYPNGYDLSSPATNTYLSFNCTPGAPGFECDQKLVELRAAFMAAPDEEARKAIATQIEERIYEFVPYGIWGQFRQPSAYSTHLEGLIQVGIPVFWNVSKN